MVTVEENRRNLRSAEKLVANDMGVNPDAALDYAQRTEFSRRLATKILQYPDRFSSGTLETARRIANKEYEPIADPSFSWTDFASGVVDNAAAAGDSVADVGRGALGLASAMRWVIPVAGVVAVGLLLWRLWRKANS